jgi:hypothetical protein
VYQQQNITPHTQSVVLNSQHHVEGGKEITVTATDK